MNKMEQEIIKVLKQYSVKYKQLLCATEEDLVIIGDHFQEISEIITKIIFFDNKIKSKK